ncbi:MAG: hypothetical protein KJ757_07415 [Planctomycetes bacterium]|nr:hypothetical protein [Planctomycetota bacterium]MBU1517777.1 hypothetical protein [Planctomycetota bacterium]MBU2458368.1 hypothetical protein [Planctomycetota bacterium]MBU2597370.1 hypothetical protein [Planctomycetota bacterium]
MPKKRKKQQDSIQKAIDYGIDIQMLKDNLKRSVEERLSRHQSALNLVRLFQKAQKNRLKKV